MYKESNNNYKNSKTKNDLGFIEFWFFGGLAVGAVALNPIMFGFGTNRVAARSLAALSQSSIGAVSAGSCFATATSLGMKGVFVKTVIAGGVSAAIGAANRGNDNFKKQDYNQQVQFGGAHNYN